MHKAIHIPVDEFTTPAPVTVHVDTPILEVEKVMSENSFRHIPVVDGERAVGIVSQRELNIFANFQAANDLKAMDIMTTEPFKVRPEMELVEVAYEMSRRKLGSAIVCDQDERIVGIFTSTDALNALIEILRGDFED